MHGDIRNINLVFGISSAAHIIDFDYIPISMETSIPQVTMESWRKNIQTNAIANREKDFSHDWHSLVYCIANKV